MTPRRTSLARLLVLALLALVVVACGDDGADASADAGTGSGDRATEADAGPVTVEHLYGETTLETTPQRIVSLDTQWTDVLVALDGPLVAAGLDPVPDDGRFPWQDGLPDSVEPIPVADAIPYEAVAAARPDLIVITYFATDEATYEKLSGIAPTIPLLGDEEVDAWQDIATTAGQILDQEDEAEQLIADAAQLTADVLAELPGLDGKTYALANYVAGDGIYVVADPDDGASRFFAELGMEIEPDLVAMADGASGRTKLSAENIDELDSDLLLILTNGTDTADIAGYDQLPAVQSGAALVMDVEDVSGLNTPTPLSIPYCLDLIRPVLEAVAAA